MKSKIEARQSFVNITKCNVKSLCVVTTFINVKAYSLSELASFKATVSMLLQSPPIERVLREHGALLEQKRTIAVPSTSKCSDTKASSIRESRCESNINTSAVSSCRES